MEECIRKDPPVSRLWYNVHNLLSTLHLLTRHFIESRICGMNSFVTFHFYPTNLKQDPWRLSRSARPELIRLLYMAVYILWFERVRALSQKGVYKAFAVIFPNNGFQSSLGAFCERLYRHQDIFPKKRNKSNKIIHSGRKQCCKIKNFTLLRVDRIFSSVACDHALSLYPCNLLFFPLSSQRSKEAKKKKDNTWSQVIFSAVPEALRKLPLTQTHNGGVSGNFY